MAKISTKTNKTERSKGATILYRNTKTGEEKTVFFQNATDEESAVSAFNKCRALRKCRLLDITYSDSMLAMPRAFFSEVSAKIGVDYTANTAALKWLAAMERADVIESIRRYLAGVVDQMDDESVETVTDDGEESAGNGEQ